VLVNAREQARNIVSEAREIGFSEQKEAWDQGFQAGLKQAQQEQASLTQSLARLVAGAVAAREQTMHNLDQTVVTLVLEVARAVLQREPTTAPDTILNVVRHAMRDLCVATTVAIRVNPDDVACLDQQRLELGLPAHTSVLIVGDPSVTRGGCLIESGAGRVDGTIEKQLARIGSTFDDHLAAS
jgi:flagellar assembly protein FliH